MTAKRSAVATNAPTLTERVALGVLRFAVGINLVAGGVLKLWSLSNGALDGTILWAVLGGARSLVVLLCAFEVALGVMVISKQLQRAVAITLLAMLGVFSLGLAINGISDGWNSRPCGCMGALADTPFGVPSLWFSLGHNLVLALAAVAITDWASRRSA